MRNLFALVLTIAMLSAPCGAAVPPHGRPHGAGGAPASTVTVAVVQMPGGASVQTGPQTAIAELGTVSAGIKATAPGISIVRRAHSYVVVTAIGLRATSETVAGTVSLQASLDSPVPGLAVRLDGIDIGDFPVTFAGHVPIGLVTRHKLELEIPNSMAPARVPSEIPLEFGATPQ